MFKHDRNPLYIGGAAPPRLKAAVRRALLDRLDPSLSVKISTRDDSPKFQGSRPENVINRLAPGRGIHLEQSAKARGFHEEIAGAIGSVFASPWRRLLWTLLGIFR